MAKKRGAVHLDIRTRLEALATLTKWQHQLVCSLLRDTSDLASRPRRRSKKSSTKGAGRNASRQT